MGLLVDDAPLLELHVPINDIKFSILHQLERRKLIKVDFGDEGLQQLLFAGGARERFGEEERQTSLELIRERGLVGGATARSQMVSKNGQNMVTLLTFAQYGRRGA